MFVCVWREPSCFSPWRYLCLSAMLALFRRVAIIKPRFGAVRIAAHFPETLLIAGEKFDLTNPFRALPGVQLGRNHSARPAVFARQRRALPRMHEQHVG